MLHRLAALLAAAALLLAGCGTDSPPQVTFAVGEESVVTGPAQYCDLDLTECRNDEGAPVELPVPPGTPVQVEVPPEIAGSPWHIVYSYRDAAGEQVDARTPVFPPDERSRYTLELPAPEARLLTAQVQQFGPPPQANAQQGGVDFPVRGSWVLINAER